MNISKIAGSYNPVLNTKRSYIGNSNQNNINFYGGQKELFKEVSGKIIEKMNHIQPSEIKPCFDISEYFRFGNIENIKNMSDDELADIVRNASHYSLIASRNYKCRTIKEGLANLLLDHIIEVAEFSANLTYIFSKGRDFEAPKFPDKRGFWQMSNDELTDALYKAVEYRVVSNDDNSDLLLEQVCKTFQCRMECFSCDKEIDKMTDDELLKTLVADVNVCRNIPENTPDENLRNKANELYCKVVDVCKEIYKRRNNGNL